MMSSEKVTMISTESALIIFSLAIGAAGCAQTARGVVTDTKENAAGVRGVIETLDVKTAIIADKTVDAGAIDVDTYQDRKVVVLRGSVPTEAQKAKAEQIARNNATGYTIENRLAVVPN
jgi:BON domain